MKRLRYLCVLILATGLASTLAMSSSLARKRTPASHTADALMRPLLAKKVGGAVCFSGTFENSKVNIWDYAKAKPVPVPGLFRFGEQVMRPEPHVYVDQRLTAMTLLLHHDERTHEHWDEMHVFQLQISLQDWPSPLKAAGECQLRFTNRPIEGRRDITGVTTTRIFCGIDCDGGLMEVERVAGAGDLIFRFDPRGGGLRMSAGCSGGQPYHVGGDAKPYDEALQKVRKPMSFRLTPLTGEACEAFRKATAGKDDSNK
jgi:hypothetical protein